MGVSQRRARHDLYRTQRGEGDSRAAFRQCLREPERVPRLPEKWHLAGQDDLYPRSPWLRYVRIDQQRWSLPGGDRGDGSPREGREAFSRNEMGILQFGDV